MQTSYIPSTTQEQEDLLRAMGLRSVEELLCAIPQSLRVKGGLKLPKGKSELEVTRLLTALSEENTVFPTIFRGAGAYRHFIPSVVRHICSREEFVTAYTPYQAELSQGVLAAIFEYQTMICRLCAMDASNASVYDGPAAAAEGVLLCTERNRKTVLVSQGLPPEVQRTVETYCAPHNVLIKYVPLTDGVTDCQELAALCGPETACVLFAQTNYFGHMEDGAALAAIAHQNGAKLVAYVNLMTLALLQAPGDYGADLAVGDAQPCGLPLAFGGPYLGFMASTKALVRKLPGRIVGETSDQEGRRAFVLTLQAREQHIRREKSSSSICSNQALCAMMVNVYLSAMGPQGLCEVARQCFDKAHYAAAAFCSVKGFRLQNASPFFHEFVTVSDCAAEAVCSALEENKMLAGLPLDEHRILWCCTEMNTKEEIDQAAAILKALEKEGA